MPTGKLQNRYNSSLLKFLRKNTNATEVTKTEVTKNINDKLLGSTAWKSDNRSAAVVCFFVSKDCVELELFATVPLSFFSFPLICDLMICHCKNGSIWSAVSK